MRAASFIEILVDQIREEVLQEFASTPRSGSSESSEEARVRAHQASQTELWLSLHLQPKTAPRGAYRVQTKAGATARPQPAAAPKQIAATPQPTVKIDRRGSAQTIPQILALEFFKREGAVLEMEFSETEFKKAFRKLALNLHPDRHAQASPDERESLQQRFSRLVECSDELSSTLK